MFEKTFSFIPYFYNPFKECMFYRKLKQTFVKDWAMIVEKPIRDKWSNSAQVSSNNP